MPETKKDIPLANNHISVDCVVFGFDGQKLKVLLVKRAGEEGGEIYHDMKLPGSLIYMDEDLDEAAERVLYELTGLKDVKMIQFKAFGSKNRTNNPKDVHWLERAQRCRVERIVTVAFIALIKISRRLIKSVDEYQACWVPVDEMKTLAFDHNVIIDEALNYNRQYLEFNPSALFDMLPNKFTASQLRALYDLIYGVQVDVRNFHKKIALMKYVIPLAEKECDVSHRAARYYKFDRKIYNSLRKAL
ncbi:MAG: NUDIX domain-containing protein [Bacteroidaceae bacterium]|nr:NUDIX hydrolase [Bacteroidaceae bacterium]